MSEQLKRAMQHRLRDRNVAGRNGERAGRDFLDALERLGATRLEERASASFVEDEAPIDSFVAWRGKAGLGGRVIADELKREVLDELERWAEETFGDLSARRPTPRHYELQGVQFVQ
jgi:hypothetical protein